MTSVVPTAAMRRGPLTDAPAAPNWRRQKGECPIPQNRLWHKEHQFMSARTGIVLDRTHLLQLHEIAGRHGTHMSGMVEHWIRQEWQRLGLGGAAGSDSAFEPIPAVAPTDRRW